MRPLKSRQEEGLLDIREAVKRLDAIINILFEVAPTGKPTPIGRRIEILDAAGLRPIEIARTLGISITNVSTRLGQIRKRRTAKKL